MECLRQSAGPCRATFKVHWSPLMQEISQSDPIESSLRIPAASHLNAGAAMAFRILIVPFIRSLNLYGVQYNSLHIYVLKSALVYSFYMRIQDITDRYF